MKVIISLSDAQDDAHRAELEKTGFWGKQAAGCLFLAKDTKRFLLAYRSSAVQDPHTLGTWGGAMDEGETPKACVLREIREESGYTGRLTLTKIFTFKHPSGFQYHNYVAVVAQEFKPKLDWETQGYEWVEFGNWPAPLHPGLKILIPKLNVANLLHNN